MLNYWINMALGWVCYQIIMRREKPPEASLMLKMAGFYAYSDGYDRYRQRQS